MNDVRNDSKKQTLPVLLVIGVIVTGVLAALLLHWTLGVIDLYANTAQSVRFAQFEVDSLDWDQGSRTMELTLEVVNGGTMDILLESSRFSVYINGVYVATNTETVMNQRLEPGEGAKFQHRLVLRQFFADEIQEGLRAESPTWSVRGNVWLSVGAIKTDVPLRIHWEADNQ